jgi:hypothetical protein
VEPAHVCLNGSLADLAIQDVLQILALGKKTGQLSLQTPAGAGALVLRQGRVVASIEKGGPLLASRVTSFSGASRDALVRERITAFVHRLACCRRGEFNFKASSIQHEAVARGVSSPGIEVIGLLIDVAWRLEDETREGAPAAPRDVA